MILLFTVTGRCDCHQEKYFHQKQIKNKQQITSSPDRQGPFIKFVTKKGQLSKYHDFFRKRLRSYKFIAIQFIEFGHQQSRINHIVVGDTKLLALQCLFKLMNIGYVCGMDGCSFYLDINIRNFPKMLHGPQRRFDIPAKKWNSTFWSYESYKNFVTPQYIFNRNSIELNLNL